MSTRIKDQPANQRPRERLLAEGARVLTHGDLLAILLRTGLKGQSAVAIGSQLVSRYQSLRSLANAPKEDLLKIKGIGRDKVATLLAAFELALRMSREMHQETEILDSPAKIAALLQEENWTYSVEHFQILLLNTRRGLIRVEHISQGTLNTILVHAREVFRAAILANAAAIVLVHNHPSGDPTPSDADTTVTRDIIRAGQLLKIDVVDHIIIGRPCQEHPKGWVSLKELGFFYD
jgi:DNA repair protein RadC